MAARLSDGLENDDQQEGTRFGATLALPVNKYQSVKLYGITGYNAHRHPTTSPPSASRGKSAGAAATEPHLLSRW